MKTLMITALLFGSQAVADVGQPRSVFLEQNDGTRIRIAGLTTADDGQYSVQMDWSPFSDHFLSMRPFKCIAGQEKHWCHVPYPYPINRNISDDLIDLEYDFLFVWKRANEYGINMWNGVYYKLDQDGDRLVGKLHEIDMDSLSAPPPVGDLRPVSEDDLTLTDPDGHWLPRLIVE